MKYRIVKRPNGIFIIEQFVDARWGFVAESASSTLESIERKLEDVIANGEPKDEVIREVEV